MRLAPLCALAAIASSTPAGAQLAHGYRLEAALDPEAHTVVGSAAIRWRNDSQVSVREVYLHLYLNAFMDRGTVFMRESGGRLRRDEFEGEGRIDLQALTLGGADVLTGADRELIEGDRTQLRVPLPAEVAPGESLELEARFTSHLPPVFARSGYRDGFHMVAQWFPKMARLEPDGTWASFPYHGHGEFYADFADYELEVRAPLGFVVGATGELVDERVDGASVVRRYVARRVHDVAFAAWDAFEERTTEIEGVSVRFLSPPGFGPAVGRMQDTVRAGLSHYGEHYGPYPYPTLTVIAPPRGGGGAAGMEYPTLFTSGGPWFTADGMPFLQEDVTAHELAHQWFQGMVATNEVAWPMLDEGLTQWAHCDLMRVRHGRDASYGRVLGLRLDVHELLRAYAIRDRDDTPPPGRPAYDYEGRQYGRSVYAWTALVLETVGRTWGVPRVRRALGRYARAHRFGHPTPEDLFAAFDDEYWPGFSAAVLRPALMQGVRADVRLTRLEATADGWVIEGERRQALPVPTWVELTRPSGVVSRLPWPADSARFAHVDAEPVVAARVDPDAALLLDESDLDDARRLEPAPPRALFARLLFVAQQLFGALGP